MSMTRNDCLHQAAQGFLRKYAGMTASDFLQTAHAKCLTEADVSFFARNGEKAFEKVAAACQSRSRYIEPIVQL